MANTSSRVRLIFEGSERGVVGAAAKAVAALKALGDENTKVGKNFEKADKQATKFIGTVTKTAAVTSLVAAAGGLIGQAFAGALPVVGALGVAAGTVALGMDGIKKSAEQLQKPFEQLKKNVSGAFQQELTPVFAKLATVIPKISGGLEEMAIDISGVADKMISFISSARGVEVLKDSIKSARQFIIGLGDGLTTFLDGFLSAIASAKTEMRGFGEAFASIFGSLGTALKNLANDGTFAKTISGFSATLTGLGNVIASVVDLAIRLGAAFGDSFGVLFNSLADGIGKASPGLVDLGSALGDLFRAISPLLPVIGDLAGQFAHSLADGIRAVIPYVQEFAAWAQNNIGTIKAVAEGIVALALAVKALNIFTSVVGWVGGAVTAFGTLRTAMAGTALAAAGTRLAIGALKVVGVGAALAGIGLAMEEMGGKADTAGLHVTGLRDSLATFGKATRDFDLGFFIDQFVDEIRYGAVVWAQFKNLITGFKFEPIDFQVNMGPAKGQLDAFIQQVNAHAPTVNINGNANGAGFALREILAEIAAGKAEVQINGKSVPAQEALKYVIDLINNSEPEVQINGKWVKAGDALAQFLHIANTSTGVVTIDGKADPATGKVTQVVKLANGSTGTITVDGKPDPATGKINGVVKFADGSTGIISIDGNQKPANGKINATVTYGNGQTATIQVAASAAQAQGVIDGFITRNDGRRIRIFTSVLGAGGIASAGRLATGGPVYGPGTGTSDTAGLYALSNGEHVFTAQDVKNAGGHSAILALRRSLSGGRVPRMTAARGRAASGGSVSSSGALTIPTPQVSVAVHIGNQEITDIVRTQINTSNRQTRRTVGMGAGTSF